MSIYIYILTNNPESKQSFELDMDTYICILINGILSGGIPHKNKALLGSYTANGNKSVHSIKDRGIS